VTIFQDLLQMSGIATWFKLQICCSSQIQNLPPFLSLPWHWLCPYGY